MSARLFFALWPDDRVRLLLARHCLELARECAGRAMRPETFHLTLVFVGKVAEPRIADLMACADRVLARKFELSVDTSACFARAKVAWLGCTEVPYALADLELALRSEVTQSGFEIDVRKFKPHITVVRNVEQPCAPATIGPIAWKVNLFSLMDSQASANGQDYKVLKTWQLAAPVTR
jgi:RNA 2',3'-cyclic 3'-phosphodiesterase